MKKRYNKSNIENEFSVYMHVFSNDKVYIGITSQNPPETRWVSGNGYKRQTRMWRAIQKYGWENVDHIIVARKVNIETATNMEKDLIALYRSTEKEHGYNSTPGGWSMSEEGRKRLSALHKGTRLSEETKRRMSESLKGKKPSEKSIARLREYNRTRDYSKMVQPNEMPILQFDVETARFVGEYKSINRGAVQCNGDARNVKACVDGKVTHYKGYVWIEKEKYSPEYILKRLYDAQNPPMICPVATYDINYPEKVECFKYANEMVRAKNFDQRKVSYHMNRQTPYLGKYMFYRISIPEYIEATGKQFFDR